MTALEQIDCFSSRCKIKEPIKLNDKVVKTPSGRYYHPECYRDGNGDIIPVPERQLVIFNGRLKGVSRGLNEWAKP